MRELRKVEPVNRPQNIRLGVSLILAAALGISVQDVIFKLFSSQMSLWQIFALRGCLAVPLLIVITWAGGKAADLRPALGKWPMLRGLFITITLLCFYAAVPFISLSTAGAANYVAPVFVTLLSAYVISEPVGWRGWIGVTLGFAGVVILLQLGTDAFSPWALLPIIGAGFYATAHIITRTHCQNVPSAALSFSHNLMMTLAGFLVSALLIALPVGELAQSTPYIFGTWSPLTGSDALILMVLAGFAVGNGILLAGAYKAAPPATIATFEYTYLVFVAVWDAVFFALFPSLTSLTGMVLIMVAGLLVLRR